jgi:hypothetical protein
MLVNTIIYLLAGAALALFPTQFFDFLPLQPGIHLFFLSILGVLVFGLGLALMIERFRSTHDRITGLGLGGLIVINSCASLAIFLWLLSRSLDLAAIELSIIWTVLAALVIITIFEIVSLFSPAVSADRYTDYWIEELVTWLRGGNFVVLLLFILNLLGYIFGQLSLVQAILLWLFSSLTYRFGLQLLEKLKKGDSISVENHWGGLGGSLGGWRISTSLVLLILTLAFGLLTIMSVPRPAASSHGSASAETTSAPSANTTDRNGAP